MVSAENRTGLYVAVPVYFCLLATATIWAYRRMEQMSNDKTADKLSAHYIGGRNFGPLLITGTMFASLYSGYTVVGIPNEVFKTGWNALRWLPTGFSVIWGLIGTGFRLRRLSQIRNHQSPVDFITDRFQSQLLRYTIVFLQVLTSIIYLAVQVISIKKTFNSIFELDPDTLYPTIIIFFMILVFECIGGLNSVALTDSIQGLIMITAFLCIPVIIAKNFGGWNSLDPETYPRPDFYQTPSSGEQWGFWQFSLINFSFFTLPHFLQRIYASRDVKSLKIGYTVLCLSPWITGLVALFMGTMGVAILVNPEDGSPLSPADPFTAILEAIIDLGGFAEVCAIIAITASLAAIMSTADSLIIAISQLLTVEIAYPMMPKASPEKMAWFGRASSLIAVTLAMIIGLAWDEGINDLARIQFPLTAQVVPPFLLGLFAKTSGTDVHPWCIVAAVASSSIYVIGIYFGYLKHADKNPAAIDAGITGIVIQVVLIVSLEALYRLVLSPHNKKRNNKTHTTKLLYDRPSWDVPKMSRFGTKTLTPKLIWKSMKGFYEPMVNPYWTVLMFVSMSLITPLTAPNQPPLDEDGVTFLVPPSVVGGIPWWAFKILLLCMIPCALLLKAIYAIPNEFPKEKESKIAEKGVDVDLVQLTRKEMGRRSSYDEANVLIQKRRSTISDYMVEMGIKNPGTAEDEDDNAKVLDVDDDESSPALKRISSLVYARSLDHILEDGDNVDAEEKRTVVDVEEVISK